MNGADPRDPRVATLHGDLSGLPPLRIAVGTCEIFLDQGRELAKRASQSGVDATLAEYQDCYHLFQNLAGFIPAAEHALSDCCRFLDERLGPPAAAAIEGSPAARETQS
jgi:monoterpene epsilon-lactone hydrolase